MCTQNAHWQTLTDPSLAKHSFSNPTCQTKASSTEGPFSESLCSVPCTLLGWKAIFFTPAPLAFSQNRKRRKTRSIFPRDARVRVDPASVIITDRTHLRRCCLENKLKFNWMRSLAPKGCPWQEGELRNTDFFSSGVAVEERRSVSVGLGEK